MLHHKVGFSQLSDKNCVQASLHLILDFITERVHTALKVETLAQLSVFLWEPSSLDFVHEEVSIVQGSICKMSEVDIGAV